MEPTALTAFKYCSGGGVDAGLIHGRHPVHLGEKAFGECARLLIEVPVESGGQVQTLRGLQRQRVNVGEKCEQRRGLHGLGDAEFVGRLERVGKIGAGIRKPQHLRARGLSLQQERGVVGGAQRRAHRAQHLAAVGQHHLGRRFLQLRAEGVIGGNEEPGLAALLDDGAGRAIAERGGVVGVVDGVGRAIDARERGAARADGEEGNFFRRRNLGHGDAHAGVRSAEHQGQAVLIGPFAKLGRADIRLVLMIDAEHRDLFAEHRAAEIGDGHVDGVDAGLAHDVRIDARHVVDIADDHLIGGGDGLGGGVQAKQCAERHDC